MLFSNNLLPTATINLIFSHVSGSSDHQSHCPSKTFLQHPSLLANHSVLHIFLPPLTAPKTLALHFLVKRPSVSWVPYMLHVYVFVCVCVCVCARTRACVHAKWLQLYLTLCKPIRCSPPGSSVHGILQARVLELPFPPPGDLPKPGTEPASHISCFGRQVLPSTGTTWEALCVTSL